jgi:hypothetical protein
MKGIGHIYKRGNVWWVQYRIRGKRYRESAHQPALGYRGRKKDAETLLKQRLGEHVSGRFNPTANRVTLAQGIQLLNGRLHHQCPPLLGSCREGHS